MISLSAYRVPSVNLLSPFCFPLLPTSKCPCSLFFFLFPSAIVAAVQLLDRRVRERERERGITSVFCECFFILPSHLHHLHTSLCASCLFFCFPSVLCCFIFNTFASRFTMVAAMSLRRCADGCKAHRAAIIPLFLCFLSSFYLRSLFSLSLMRSSFCVHVLFFVMLLCAACCVTCLFCTKGNCYCGSNWKKKEKKNLASPPS